jgi:hypothetical protein
MCKKYFIGIMLLIASATVVGQSNPLYDSARKELVRMNQHFDATDFLGFDMHIRYHTDTSAGRFEQYEKTATYFLNRKHYYYKVDEMEYIQNDSFSITLDHNEKTILLAKNVNEPSGQFMMKDFVAYSLDAYQNLYALNMKMQDSVSQTITFTLADTSVRTAYRRFSVRYDINTYYPIAMEMELRDKLDIELPPNTVLQQPIPLTQRLSIRFSNYRGLPSTALFDEARYVRMTGPKHRYQPTESYQYYRLMLAGIEQDELPDSPGALMEQTP